ncbi:hypothetical protein ABFX02_13G098500 [Erythranthe guttata]
MAAFLRIAPIPNIPTKPSPPYSMNIRWSSNFSPSSLINRSSNRQHKTCSISRPSPPSLLIPSSNCPFSLLSIDGGGVRGAIPATILLTLENELQKLDGPDARLASYFDCIAGTNSGGVIASLLALPNLMGNPMFEAKDLQNFFADYSESIFKPRNLLVQIGMKVKSLISGSPYNSWDLENVLSKHMGSTTLGEACTNLIIPYTDMKTRGQLTSFTTYQETDLNTKLIDVCLSTTSGYPTEKNPLGGALHEINLSGDRRIPSPWVPSLILSLGTGIVSLHGRGVFTPETLREKKWAKINRHKRWSTAMYSSIVSEYVGYDVQKTLGPKDFYLRIQDYRPDLINMDDNLASLDNSTRMESLVEAAVRLLQETNASGLPYLPYNKMGLPYLPYNKIVDEETTNETLLRNFANLLSEQKKIREGGN